MNIFWYILWYQNVTSTSNYALNCSIKSDSLWPHGLYPVRLLWSWDFPGKNTGCSCYFLPQGIFLTQGSNLQFLQSLHWETDSLPLGHLGSPLLIIFFINNKNERTCKLHLEQQCPRECSAMMKIFYNPCCLVW